MIKYYVDIQKLKLINEESEYLNQLISSIKNASLSVKSVKDIKHNLVEFSDAVNGFLHNQYNDLIKRQIRFYKEYYQVLSRIDDNVSMTEIIVLFVLIKELDHEYLASVYSDLEQRRAPELAVSSLFNANREIYDSNKALVMALETVAIIEQSGEQFKHS